MKLDRTQALALLQEYNQSPALIKHAYAVEGVMRHFANELGEDPDYWGVIGLLHDLDYEQYPDEHCHKVRELLRSRNVDEAVIHAIASHGYGLCSEIEPELRMEQVLYTIDELTGLIAAAAIMRPSRSVLDLELKSLKKKYKDHRFAAGVKREVIENGCAMLGFDLDYVLTHTILGMRECAEALDLVGTPESEN